MSLTLILDLVRTRIITMQFSIVILLVIINFQAIRAFRRKEFRLLQYGWLANFLYLIAAETIKLAGAPAIKPFFGLRALNCIKSSADFFDFIATLLFWYVAHKFSRNEKWIYARFLNTRKFILILVTIFIIDTGLSWVPAKSDLFYLSYSIPQTFIDTCALCALAQYFKQTAIEVCDTKPPTFHLLYKSTMLYAIIQPLGLLPAFGSSGFALGFVAKIGILLGIIGLFVRSAETQINLSAEQKRMQALRSAVDRLAHELGTPISETLNYVMTLKSTKPSDIAVLLKKLESSAARAAAILGASRFSIDPAASAMSARSGVDIWVPDILNKFQVMNLNTLVMIAENAVRSTRSEDIKYYHQYSGRCCLECIPNEMIQIIINILRNSHDAALDRKGKIDIMTINDNDDKALGPKGKVKLVVRDDGEGIRSDVKRLLFTEGYSTRDGAGRGFGLTVVEKFVRKHNGTIEIVSPMLERESTGTEVTLAFPRVKCLQQ